MDNEIPLRLTEEEEIILDWDGRTGKRGSFETSLMDTINKADGINLAKLRTIYPVHVRAHERWAHEEGWIDMVRAKAGKI